jgi:uncharacterized protein (TIGR02594 family)
MKRRSVLLSLGALAASLESPLARGAAAGGDGAPLFEDLEYPKNLFGDAVLGVQPPGRLQKERARELLDLVPRGPTPFAVASSFLKPPMEAKYTEQWPMPEPWNPMIVEFFSAAGDSVENDMVPWCAAFANWCLQRAGKTPTRRPNALSFLNSAYPKTDTPRPGDLVVFGCYRPSDNRLSDFGHVGFVAESPSADRVVVLGGNQSAKGHSSVICTSRFPLKDREISRCVKYARQGVCGQRERFTFRVAAYLRVE